VYFAEAMATHHKFELAGKTAVVSGAGNVAEYTARKLVKKGATVLTLSDRSGYVYKEAGLTLEDIDAIKACKDNKDNLDTLNISGIEYKEGKVWEVAADMYFPCATQNEMIEADAMEVIKTAALIVEGANMPLDAGAQAVVRKARIPYAPGKAANAGGVSVSGMEMAQNAGHYSWTATEVDDELCRIMNHIHTQCVAEGLSDGYVDYVKGANIAGFKRVFAATKKLGL
jgi:glutamate dehydrogenase (NADP+)